MVILNLSESGRVNVTIKLSSGERSVVILGNFTPDSAFGTYHKLFLGVKIV